MKGFPNKRHIYNRTDRPWTVHCHSDQVFLDGGLSSAVVSGNTHLGMSFRNIGKNGEVPEETQRDLIGEYRPWAYYLGEAKITIKDDDESISFELVLVGDNTKSYHGWTPVYRSTHVFANKNWKFEQLFGDICIFEP